jgi:4-amino-4-deoxy-L-arabinose transferase-like glycosyltransferase
MLWGLILVGVGVRLWNFGNNPISLNRDETALAYNAYSLLKEGVDEWGRSWPFLFESFGDYKLPGYIYVLIPFISILGTDNWVIRLPSLISGLILIVLAYHFARKIFGSTDAGWWAAAIMAISPWAIFYSRMAWEANVALMWLVAALLAMEIRGIRSYILVGLFFSLAILTYNTPLLLTPVIIVYIWLRVNFPVHTKLVYSIIFGLLSLGMVVASMSLLDQKQAITIFSDPTITALQQEQYVEADTLIGKMWVHKYTTYVKIMAINFWESLNPTFLILGRGGHPWHTVPGYGHFYWSVWFLMMVSLIYYFKDFLKRQWHFLAFLFLMYGSLLVAVVTVDAPHATRSLLFFFMVAVLSVYGVSKYQKLAMPILIGLFMELLWFGYGYLVVYPANFNSWTHGLHEAVVTAMAMGGDSIVITNGDDRNNDMLSEQLYIYVLWATKMLPSQYISDSEYLERDNVNLIRVSRLKNIKIMSDAATIPLGSIVVERQDNGNFILVD